MYTAVVGGCSEDSRTDAREVESILSSDLWKFGDNECERNGGRELQTLLLV